MTLTAFSYRLIFIENTNFLCCITFHYAYERYLLHNLSLRLLKLTYTLNIHFLYFYFCVFESVIVVFPLSTQRFAVLLFFCHLNSHFYLPSNLIFLILYSKPVISPPLHVLVCFQEDASCFMLIPQVFFAFLLFFVVVFIYFLICVNMLFHFV